MKITWYGTATLRLECEEGRVLIDPFVRRYGNAEERLLSIFRREDTIAITHGHFDHISDMYHIFGKRHNIKVYATKTPIETLKKDGMSPEVFHEIAPGEQIKMKGFCAKVWQGEHIQFDRTLMIKTLCSRRIFAYFSEFMQDVKLWRRYLDKGETLFWEFQAEGKRVQIMGSAAITDNVVYSIGADLLALAYQGRSDIVTYVQPMIRRLKPKCIMPIHFDDSFPPISSEMDMNCFEDMMKNTFPEIKLVIPQLDVAYEV